MASSDYTNAFKDIPGTTVFDATQSRLGFHLNQFCMSLMKADNRSAFKADEAAYLQKFRMTDAQREAVLARDYNRMISLGGNIYFLAKIGATDGFSFQNLASKMTGMAEESYRDMMVGGGRPATGNRSVAEWAAAVTQPAAAGPVAAAAATPSSTAATSLATDADDQNAQAMPAPASPDHDNKSGGSQHG